MQRWWVGAALVAILVVIVPRGAFAQSEAQLSQARARFAEGVRHLNRGRWAPAASAFRDVMRVRATPQVKYNLGLALSHMEEEDRREARTLLREAQDEEALGARSRRDARRRLEQIGPGPEPQSASAQTADGSGEPSQQRPYTLDVHAGLSFWGVGFVTGARFGIPLVHELFPGIDNALYLNFGFDFYYVSYDLRPFVQQYGPGFGLPITLHWEIYFDAQWSGFLEIGGQFFVHPLTFDNDRYDAYEPAFFFLFAIGASWRFHENIALTLRVGTPYAALGLTFLF